MNALEKNIIATLSFYDVLERPLTALEIFCSLIRYADEPRPALCQMMQTLKESPSLKEAISERNGLYFLKNRARLLESRAKKEKISIAKWKKARMIAKFLQISPFIRMIGVTGSLAINNTKPSSDLDLFIIAKSSRIWLVRIFTIIITQILGKRRHGKKIKDRVCLNSYFADTALKIEVNDLYSANEYLRLIPLFTWRDTFEKFKSSNSWTALYFIPAPYQRSQNQKAVKTIPILRFFARSAEFLLDGKIGDKLEWLACFFQKSRIVKNPVTSQGNSQIIFNDNCLIFHPIPRAPLVQDLYASNICKAISQSKSNQIPSPKIGTLKTL